MATSADFSTGEWSQVLGSVMMAGMAVTLADPSGLIGMAKEGLASGCALVAAKTDPSSNELIKAVVSSYETSDGRAAAREVIKTKLSGKKPEEMKAIILESLKQTAALVEVKAAADAAAFKTWLRQISERVANASNEGGFLGIGGVRVSDQEKATLAEVSAALKLNV